MAYARKSSRSARPRRATRRAAPRRSASRAPRAGGVLRIVVENGGAGVQPVRHLGPGGGVQPVAAAPRARAKF